MRLRVSRAHEEDRLTKENDKEKRRRKVSSNEGLQIALPDLVASSIEGIGKGKKKEAEKGEDAGVGEIRWLRVNTIKWSTEEAVEWFETERWELADNLEDMLEISCVLILCPFPAACDSRCD